MEKVQEQNVVNQVKEFLSASTPHWVVGLTIFSELVADFQPLASSPDSRSRRAAQNFKDSALPRITSVGVATLQNISLDTMSISNQQEERKLLQQVLQMVRNSFSFDFMGVMPDDASDDQSTVMVPMSWDFLHSANLTETLFSLYKKSWTATPPWPQCARLCLQTLVLLAAFRRTFFPKESERLLQIGQLVSGTANILETHMGLDDDDCYHELCRLLGKIRAANQINDLAASPAFSLWIEQAFRFTMHAMVDWKHLPNSKHYLLGLWGGLVSPRRNRHDVESYVEQVTSAYIESRLQIAEAMASNTDDDFENPLNNEVLRSEQLEVLSVLGRSCYVKIATQVMQSFDTVNNEGRSRAISQDIYLEKLTWLVYMIGALIGGHKALLTQLSRASMICNFRAGIEDSGNSDSGGKMESAERSHCELAVRVFRLISESESHATGWSENMEAAFLYFLEQFRKYMVFRPMRRPQATILSSMGSDEEEPDRRELSTMASMLGLGQEDELPGLVVRKAIFNLQKRTTYESVVQQSLQLLTAVCNGVGIAELNERPSPVFIKENVMLRTALIPKILHNHSGAEFEGFFANPRYTRMRTQYFANLMKLLLLELRFNENQSTQNQRFSGQSPTAESPLQSPKFDDFMAPFVKTFAHFNYQCNKSLSVASASMTGATPGAVGVPFSAAELANPTYKQTLIGIFRDLRGLLVACHSPESYLLLFNWLVNDPKNPQRSRISLMSESAKAWWADHEVMIPLLRLAAEICYNRGRRILFDSTSASGLILFKEISTILAAYGHRILQKQFHEETATGISAGAVETTLYRGKYKGLARALEMYSNALCGDFTNFGVFEMYNDHVLSSSLSLAFDMCLAIPNDDLQAYFKTLKPVYAFLEVVTKTFVAELMSLQPVQLASLFRSIEDGLCAFDSSTAMQACATLDHVVVFIFNKRALQDEDGEKVRKFLLEQPEALKRMLQVCFQLLMAGEAASTWSISRPVLGLILLHEQEFIQIKEHYVQSPLYNEERQQLLRNCFEQLMNEVAADLRPANKDLFTRNMFKFAHQLRLER
eukprot:Lankesteria_metandrocarpae@DN3691_c0_g1_i1.p1